MSAQRFLTKEKAAVEVYGKNGVTIASVKNLSKTGACLIWEESEVPVLKGDLIRITIYLKALNRRHKVSGEVIWFDGKFGGIQFLSSEQLLDKIVDRGV